jgi:hypothetical protein
MLALWLWGRVDGLPRSSRAKETLISPDLTVQGSQSRVPDCRGLGQRANNWKLLIVNALRMAPASCWLSRAGSGSHVYPGGRKAYLLLLGLRGTQLTPSLGAQLNRLWPQPSWKFCGDADSDLQNGLVRRLPIGCLGD